jgi:hypothetical protein
MKEALMKSNAKEIKKLRKKLAEIKAGKWIETPERVKILEQRLKELERGH